LQVSVNIVCLDVPYPANYGGAINMFHKIRWLHKQGVNVHLHCFEYGDRKAASELNSYCKEVSYYRRKTGLGSFLSLLPYNVQSRISEDLKTNLLKNDFPIIFEALHTCYLMRDTAFKNRQKIFRESNIEHDYFYHLAKNEKNFAKKIYLYTEANKLKRFEKILRHADLMLIVSTEDVKHFQECYPKNDVKYLPSFHQNDELLVAEGTSDYILYHGNLSVSENYRAAEWLIQNVFSKVNQKVIVAGLNPPQFLKALISAHPHITLKANCTESEMDALIGNAHIHCLYTAQATGLKLKLLNVLFKGRFVIANNEMVHGTDLDGCCVLANTVAEYITAINNCFGLSFSHEQLQKRVTDLQRFQNNVNSTSLINYLTN
jgi:hypothetical protein